MKFISHLFLGILFLLLFYFLIHPSLSILLPASIAMLFGAVLPDIDHPFAYVRKAFRLFAFLALFFVIFVFALTPSITNLFLQQCANYGCNNFIILAQVLSSAIISFILVMIIDFFIPFHRGPLHGVTAAVGYALIWGIFTSSFTSEYFVVAAAGLIGYLSHIIPDALLKE